jgi:hypothetical protein
VIKERTPDEHESEEQPKEDSEIEEIAEAIRDFMNTEDTHRKAEIVRMVHDILHDYMTSGNREED